MDQLRRRGPEEEGGTGKGREGNAGGTDSKKGIWHKYSRHRRSLNKHTALSSYLMQAAVAGGPGRASASYEFRTRGAHAAHVLSLRCAGGWDTEFRLTFTRLFLRDAGSPPASRSNLSFTRLVISSNPI